jgi:hypothetical protein
MFGDGRVNDPPALVGQNNRHVKQPKRCERHDEHVDGRDAFGVIPQEGAPVLRGRSSPSHHVLGDRRLADLDTELEQFAVDPRRAPERVGAAHLPNQVTNLALHRRPPGSRAPTPKEAEAPTVPLNHRCRLDQHHRLQTAWPQSVEQDPEQAVEREQPEPTRPLAAKNVQLMAQGGIL